MGPTFLVHLIVFGSALAATVSGYGFVLVASPLLLLLLPPAEAVPLSILLGWTVPFVLLTRGGAWRWVARGYALRLVSAGIFGIPLGAWLLFTVDPRALRLALGLIVSTIALVNLRTLFRVAGVGGRAPRAPSRGPGAGECARPEGYEARRGPGPGQRPLGARMHFRTVTTGFLAGIMSGAAGLSGPFTILHLSRLPLDKHHLRATTATTILLLSSVTLSIYTASGRLHPQLGLTALSLLPALGLGMLAGSRLFHVLPERRFRQVTLSFAALAGLGTALAALASW